MTDPTGAAAPITAPASAASGMNREQAKALGIATLGGTLMVNSSLVMDLRMPFGGYNESGIGREGIEGMRALYTEEKSVAMALRPFKPALRFGASETAA